MQDPRLLTDIATARPKPKKRECTVWIERYKSDTIEHLFYCHDCRNPLLSYIGDVVKVIPGHAQHEASEFPFTAQCSNVNCRKKYKFVGYVTLDK